MKHPDDMNDLDKLISCWLMQGLDWPEIEGRCRAMTKEELHALRSARTKGKP